MNLAGIVHYTVQRGDSLASIGRRFYGIGRHWDAIYAANRQVVGNDPNHLRLGLQLIIPPADFRAYTVQSGDTLSAIAQRFYGDAERWNLIYETNLNVIGNNPELLRLGLQLVIPDIHWVSVYPIQAGDTLSAIAQRFYGNTHQWQDIYKRNWSVIGDDPNRLHLGTQLVIPHITGAWVYTVQAEDTLSAIAQYFYKEAQQWPIIYETNRSVIGSDPNHLPPNLALVIFTTLPSEVTHITRLTTLPAHQNAVTGIAFTPKGDAFATGSWDTWVRLWQTDGTVLGTPYPGDKGSVSDVEVDPRGNFIISTTFGGTVRLSDFNNQTLQQFPGRDGSIFAVAVNPTVNSQTEGFLAIGSADGKVRLLTQQGTLLRELAKHRTSVSGVALSPGGDFLVTASTDQQVHLWTSAGDYIRTLAAPEQEVSQVAVAFSFRGQAIAAGGGATVRLWTSEGKLLTILKQQSGVNDIALSPSGRYLAVACFDRTIAVWDLQANGGQGKLAFTLTDHHRPVTSLAFSREGSLLVSGDEGGIVFIWKME
ncbi:MAG: LysM peptidoglycan-binding domain-containing protein [Oscillatoriophycideae cyanobacterium NC_groundwater_1537_Pr4_S-0.65um_50_18]|nr:LysM peptidoglycan-binding domain-containing protein [Oscillatoriophycideae cyanobacterium NC_groundwater_1537_Pr4_S-0.65um_50_18]